MDNAMDIIAELEKLRWTHLVVEEDCWYSCPKSGECCNSVQSETDCNCGADFNNEILDGIISSLKRSRLRGRTVDDLPESIRDQLFKCAGNVADVNIGGVYVRYKHNGIEWIRSE